VPKFKELSLEQFVALRDEQLIDAKGERMTKKAFVAKFQTPVRKPGEKQKVPFPQGWEAFCREQELRCVNPNSSPAIRSYGCGALAEKCTALIGKE
jgi:hypothetical protein